jgi:hypothetical protein
MGSGTQQNVVSRTFNSFGQLIAELQGHNGEFTGTVHYSYESGDNDSNQIRQTGVTSPGGGEVQYLYSSGGSPCLGCKDSLELEISGSGAGDLDGQVTLTLDSNCEWTGSYSTNTWDIDVIIKFGISSKNYRLVLSVTDGVNNYQCSWDCSPANYTPPCPPGASPSDNPWAYGFNNVPGSSEPSLTLTDAGVPSPLNRVGVIMKDGAWLAGYDYIGENTVVRVDVVKADDSTSGLTLDLWGGTTGTFNGLDRFNRIIDQRWIYNGTDVDRFKYGYDRNSNRQWKENTVSKSIGSGESKGSGFFDGRKMKPDPLDFPI